ncbi:MAG: hypothetical protein ABR584_01855 [Candidatus Baltobacteraceae bacterium]
MAYTLRLFVLAVLAFTGMTAQTRAQAPAATLSASPSPAPSPAASAAPDPCGGDARLLATLNRPTVGYSACAVAPGTLVVEEGYQNTQQGSGTTASTLIQYPQSFIRYGLKQGFEIDLIGPSFNKLAAPEGAGGLARSSGYSDGGLGIKYEFTPHGRYTVGIDGLYTGANGSPGFTGGGPTQTLNLDVAYSITPTFGIGTTLAYSSTSGFDAAGKKARFSIFLPSFVLTTQLANNYQLYSEYVYASKLAPDVGGRSFFDFGVQKLLGKRFELDIEQGISSTPDSNLKFNYIGVGFGWQIR